MWSLSLMHIQYVYCIMNRGWKNVVLWRWKNSTKFSWRELTLVENYAQKIVGEISCGSFDRLDIQSLNDYKISFLFFVFWLKLCNFSGAYYTVGKVSSRPFQWYIKCPQILKILIAKPKQKKITINEQLRIGLVKRTTADFGCRSFWHSFQLV